MSIRKAFMSLPLGGSGFVPTNLSPDIYESGGVGVLESIGPDDPAEDADKVRRWLDQSSNAFFSENPTVSIQPTFRSTGLGGKPSVDFLRSAGEGMYYKSASSPSVPGVAGVGDVCRNVAESYMAIVIDPLQLDTTPGFQHIIGCSINGSTAARFSIAINGDNRLDLNTKRLDADSNDILSLMNAGLVNKPTIVIAHINWATGFKTLRAINDTVDVNNTKTAAHGTGNTQDTESTMVSKGAASGGVVPFDGDIAADFWKASILSTPDEALLVNFFKDEYGI